jgi:DNA topoisomerase-1
VFTVGLNRAVSLLAEPKKGRGQKAQTALKSLGEHPELGGEIKVLAGRYGPYVKHGKVNATIPKGTEPEQITVDEAVKLIAERAANGKAAGTKTKAKAKTKAKSAKPKQKAPSANSEASA